MVGIRGETVGTAFVRILADGGELGDDIERQLREHEDAFKAAGERDSNSYTKAFDKAQKDSPTWAKLTQSLNKAVANSDVTADFFNGPGWKNFQESMEKRFGPDIGRRLILGIESEFRRSGSLSGLTDEIETNLIPRVARIVEEIGAQTDEVATTTERDNNRISRSFSAIGRAFRNGQKDVDRFAVAIGRFFGKGSRNNFLNFFGSVITNALRFGNTVIEVFEGVFSVVGKVFSGITGFIGDFRKQMAQGSSAAEAFFTTLSTGAGEGVFTTIATGGANLVIGLALLAGALGIVVISVGVLVSALILLGGTIIALAATIEFALIAAVAAIGPLLLPLAGIIAGIIATVFEFKHATGELKTSLAKVKTAAKGLFAEFKSTAFKNAPKLTDKVSAAMDRLEPITRRAGRGFNRFASIVIDSLTSPEIQKFEDRFARFLPSAMGRLGDIFSNTFEGLAGILRASIPLANQLLGWLQKITQNFSDFTNSKDGQKAIRQFLRDAADSARSLGRFLGEAAGLIQDLLTGGQDTGDSLFNSMADALARVRQFLQENPDALKNFFTDAKNFAEQVGHAIEDIADAIDKIDTPQTRRAATALIGVLGQIILIAAQVITWFQRIAGAGIDMAGFVIDAFVGMATGAIRSLQKIVDGFGHLAGIIPGLDPGINAAVHKFDEFADGAVGDLNGISDHYHALTDAISKTPTMDIDTGPALGKLNVLSSVIHTIQQAITNAQAHAAAVAQNHGTQNTDTGPHTGGSQDEGVANGSRTSDRVTINVITPTTDPKAVATETVNRLVAFGLT